MPSTGSKQPPNMAEEFECYCMNEEDKSLVYTIISKYINYIHCCILSYIDHTFPLLILDFSILD